MPRTLLLQEGKAELWQYDLLPLDGWEHTKLINTCLILRWVYRRMLVLDGWTVQDIDRMTMQCVKTKGMGPRRSKLKVVTYRAHNGMVLHQTFSKWRQSWLPLEKRCREKEHNEIWPPLTSISKSLPTSTIRGPDLYHSEDSDEGLVHETKWVSLGVG